MFKHFYKKLEKKITFISSMEYDPVFFSFEWLLNEVSKLYKTAAGLRLWMYQSALLKSKTLPCLVISIGNITAGGSGKTPMAIYLAQLLTKLGKNPVVISRGYKGSFKKSAQIVGDGNSVFLNAQTAGDEPFMMARQMIFPVVVGKDRYKAGMLAVNHFNPGVIILDDGFQHIKLKKDLNILLFNHDKPLGNKKMLPAGRLRETPDMSKNRTHAIIFTKSPEKKNRFQTAEQQNNKDREDIKNRYKKIPYFKSFHTPFLVKLIPCRKNSKLCLKKKDPAQELDMLKDKKALLFSGIANNKAFAADMEKLGCKISDHLEFDDHFRYTGCDIQMIQKKIDLAKPDIVITTEKDWVKLKDNVAWNADMAVVGIDITFQDEKQFKSFIRLKTRQ